MAILLSRTLAAFREAGVPEEMAEAAAREPYDLIGDLGDRITRLETRTTRVEVKLNVLLTINVAVLLLLLRDALSGQ